MDMESKYLLDYETCIKECPSEADASWETRYKALMESKDESVYNFIMQYIFM